MELAQSFPEAELAKESDLALFDDNYPVEILPVGCTLMGGLVILITHVEDRGDIALKVAYDGSFYLCSGIRDFFGRVRDVEE